MGKEKLLDVIIERTDFWQNYNEDYFDDDFPAMFQVRVNGKLHSQWLKEENAIKQKQRLENELNSETIK